MYEELKMILELLGDLGAYAVWVAVAYFMFKLVTLASWVLLIKYVVTKIYDYAIANKKEVFKLDGHFVDSSRESFLSFVESIKGADGIQSQYIHSSDIEFVKKAIKEKQDRDKSSL